MLTDLACRSARPKPKRFKLTDGGGLYLEVMPTGAKSWRWKYRFDGKEKRLTFGPYPAFSLVEARAMREAAAKVRQLGRDPAEERKRLQTERAAEAVHTFDTVVRRWHERKIPTWSEGHARQVLKSLEQDVFPATAQDAPDRPKLWSGRFGDLPIAAITPPMVLAVLRPIEDRGAVDQAHRTRQRMSDAFVFAIAEGIGTHDPAAIIQKALRPVRKGRYPAFLKLAGARRVLELTEAAPGYPVTKLASRLMAITAVRTEPLRFAAPAEFEDLDGDRPLWRIPPEKMKLQLEHKTDEAFEFIVPLPWQAVEVVKEALKLAGRGTKLLFPGTRHWHRPMSENAISSMYSRFPEISGRHVPHGWRSSFSTIMNELAIENDTPEDEPIIDLMLAHKPTGVKAVYNRAAYMTRRRQLAQAWADMLLEGMPPAEQLLKGPRK